ncbi:MAG: type II toxin-antitoxin system VapC family toxin [Actinobacteria bacterium]|nr:type II toxin-antitoxin system VapC family toxin [Actinomycetota bacterium]
MLDERGADEARELYRSSAWIQSSRLLVPEVRAAIARARRMGRLRERAAERALLEATTLLAEVEPVEVDGVVASQAGELADAHALRAYDAVHLASYGRVESPTSVFVAADGELVRAAISVGHDVAVLGR